MKKRVLLYLYRYFPYETANTNVMLPFIDALKKEYKLDIYTANVDHEALPKEKMDGVTVLRNGKTLKWNHWIYHTCIRPPDSLQKPFVRVKRRLLWLLHHLTTAERLYKKWPPYVLQPLEKILRRKHYAALITVTAPIEPQKEALALAKSGFLRQRGIRWFAFFSDPHATFIGNQHRYKSLMRQEMDIYAHADRVFLTEELYADLVNTPLAQYRDKCVGLPVATLKPLPEHAFSGTLPPGKIHCVYAGSLFNHRVRDPEYFYRLIQAAPPEFCFHIACNAMDAHNRALRREYLNKAPNVVWHGELPLADSLGLMQAADVLVNLGNKCTNQVPSKVFDYMAAGKPIVNIAAIPEDTAARVLARYPLALTLQQQKPLPGNVKQFAAFCRRTRGKTLPFEEVRQLYAACAPEQVAARFVQALGEAL